MDRRARADLPRQEAWSQLMFMLLRALAELTSLALFISMLAVWAMVLA